MWALLKEKGFWRNVQLGSKETHILNAVSTRRITLLSCKEIVLIPCLIQNSSICEFKDSWIKILPNIQYDLPKHNQALLGCWYFCISSDLNKPHKWEGGFRRVALVASGALLNKQLSRLIRSAPYRSRYSAKALRGMRQCITTSENAITKQIWQQKVSSPEFKLQGSGTWHSPQPVTWGRWVGLLQFQRSEAISKQNRGKSAPEPKETTGLCRNISSSKLNQVFFHQAQGPAAARPRSLTGRTRPQRTGRNTTGPCHRPANVYENYKLRSDRAAPRPPPPAGRAVPGQAREEPPGRLGKSPPPCSRSRHPGSSVLTLTQAPKVPVSKVVPLATSLVSHKNSWRHCKAGRCKSSLEMDVFPGITWVSRTPPAPHPEAPGPAVPAAGPARWNPRRWGNTSNRAEIFRTSRIWEQM